jgi:hypothetical protein
MWCTRRSSESLDKSIGGASPLVFVPRTLGRTWGTRPVSGRFVDPEGETADPSASLGACDSFDLFVLSASNQLLSNPQTKPSS